MNWKTSIFLVSGILALVVLFFFIFQGFGYNSLEKAIQAQWKYRNDPIKIKNVNEHYKLVVYLDITQYVFNEYKFKNNKYYYSGDNASGWTMSADTGPPFLVRIEERNNNKFIWGAVTTDESVDKIVVKYKNKEIQEIGAVNNTFISELTDSFKKIDKLMLMGVLEEVKAFDRNSNVIATWKP